MYVCVCIHVCMYIYIYIYIYSRDFDPRDSKSRLSEPRTIAYPHFKIKCPLKFRSSEGLGPFFQIELLKANNFFPDRTFSEWPLFQIELFPSGRRVGGGSGRHPLRHCGHPAAHMSPEAVFRCVSC